MIEACSYRCACTSPSVQSSFRRNLDNSIYIINEAVPIESRKSTLKDLKFATGFHSWSFLKRLTLKTSLPWLSTSRSDVSFARKFTYHVFSDRICALRMDGVRFVEGGRSFSGIVQDIVKFTSCPCIKYFIVRRLVPVDPESGNEKITYVYNHRRWKYKLQQGNDVELSMIPISDVLHPLPLLIDAYDYGQRHGISTRVGSKPDTVRERLHIRFYQVHGWPLSTLSEKTVVNSC